MTVSYARYRIEGDEYIQYVALTSIKAGQPIEIEPGSGWWGVAPLDIEFQKPGDLRVSGTFNGLKANQGESFSRGDPATFIPDQGFVGSADGTWRVLYDSDAGQTHVVLEINVTAASAGGGPHPEEVEWNSGALVGIAPPDAKIGVDYETGQLYYKDGSGLWQPVPGGGVASLEDIVYTQQTPSSVWVINHSLGTLGLTMDDCTIFDGNGRQVDAKITNPTTDQTVIEFSFPETGSVNIEYHQEPS